MNLAPTPEQQAIKDAVRRFASEQVTPERLAAWQRSAAGIDAETWEQVAGLGWFGLGLPVAAGGSGLGLVEVACLLEECGRGLVPRPVSNAVVAAMALGAVDPHAAALADLAQGRARLALAFDEPLARSAEAYSCDLRRNGGRATVSGRKSYVADAEAAAMFLVAARDSNGVGLVLVDRADVEVTPLRSFDGDRQAVVDFRDSTVRRELCTGQAGSVALQRVQRLQTALALAEMIGGMDAALSMTVDYVKQREQFGQKLAVFQAVQHQVADMATSLTAGRHLAWQAICRLAQGGEAGGDLATAAAFVGQAYKRVTLAAHHLHGGAGYVVEHRLHYYAERAQALCIRHTPEAAALAEVAATLLGPA